MNTTASFYDHVKSGEAKLNDLENEIMRYLINLREDINEATAKGVAAHFFVAPNTITRLTHKLGFSGFTELKASYLASLARNQYTIEHTSLDLQLIQTKELVSDLLVDRAARAVRDAQTVLFLCSGLSKYPCFEIAEKLQIMGKKTDTLYERHVMRHYTERLEPGDVVFAVSISGETAVSIEAATIAKSRGATVVTLTGLSKNPLAQLADIPFYTVEKQIFYDNMDLCSRLMFYYVFQAIFERFFELSQEKAALEGELRPE